MLNFEVKASDVIMANFIPSKDLVRKILDLNRLDFEGANKPGLMATYAYSQRTRDIRDRNRLLDRVSETTFQQVFAEHPELFIFYANLWIQGNGWENKMLIPGIELPPAVYNLVPRMLHIEDAMDRQKQQGGASGYMQMADALSNYEDTHLLPKVDDFAKPMADWEGAMRRKEILWGKQFTGRLEASLTNTATWLEVSVQEMLEANKMRNETVPATVIPKQLVKAAANIAEIETLLATERDRTEGLLEPKSRSANIPLPERTFLENAEWWHDYALQHGTPNAMRAAAKIKHCVEQLDQTQWHSQGTSLMELIDLDKIREMEARIATDYAEQLQIEVTRSIRAIRKERRGRETTPSKA